MNEDKVIGLLESIVFGRHDSISDIQDYLKRLFNVSDLSLAREKEQNALDYNLVGHFENDEVYCDFDIYYLYDRQGRMLITEVGYEFE